jgi:hypothetical protein
MSIFCEHLCESPLEITMCVPAATNQTGATCLLNTSFQPYSPRVGPGRGFWDVVMVNPPKLQAVFTETQVDTSPTCTPDTSKSNCSIRPSSSTCLPYLGMQQKVQRNKGSKNVHSRGSQRRVQVRTVSATAKQQRRFEAPPGSQDSVHTSSVATTPKTTQRHKRRSKL